MKKQKKLQLKKTNKIRQVLEDYYWTHRNFRVSRLHKHSGISFKDFEDICYGNRKPSMSEILRVVTALRMIRKVINDKISKCVQELLNEYVK